MKYNLGGHLTNNPVHHAVTTLDRSAHPAIPTSYTGARRGLSERFATPLFWFAILSFLVVATFAARSKGAWSDEGWYGGPAANLAAHGSMGTPNSFGLQGIREHTYWEMPGFIVALAAWMKLVGVGLFRDRLLNVFLGCAALVLWYTFLKLLGWRPVTAAMAIALTSVDVFFMMDATWLRADMLSLVFCVAAYTVYLALRKDHLSWAIFAASACTAAAGLTHPNAGMISVIGMVVLLWPDRRAVRPIHLLVALTPFVLLGLIWGLYISKAPADFASQFAKNSRGRFRPILHPLDAMRDEMQRYLQAFGLRKHDSSAPKAVMLKGVILAAYWLGAAYTFVAGVGKRVPHVVQIALLLALSAAFLTFFDATRTTYYLTFVAPLYAACLAWTVCEGWRRGGLVRISALGLVVAVWMVGVAFIVVKARQAPNLSSLYSLANDLARMDAANERTIASSQFGFPLGFDGRRYTDDEAFGLNSGVRPRWIVVDARFQQEVLDDPQRPDCVAAQKFIHTQCRLASERYGYDLYACPAVQEVSANR